MFFEITPEFLSVAGAALLALLFDWMPGIRQWFDGLTESQKRQTAGGMVMLVVLLIYALQCANLVQTGLTCDQVGFTQIVYSALLALGVNQGIHLIAKPAKHGPVKALSESAQGLVEYALILVLVAVVVIAALTVLGPIIGNIFSNINNSLNR
jgi:pilus assembly protein Flp/PilA